MQLAYCYQHGPTADSGCTAAGKAVSTITFARAERASVYVIILVEGSV